MKALFIIFITGIAILGFSFTLRMTSPYKNLYSASLTEFKNQQAELEKIISETNLSEKNNLASIRKHIGMARLKMKNVDFWLRYYQPDAYRKINGPMPVEWESEVFEKFEPPYRKEGAGLSLAEISLDQKPLIKDSLLALIQRSEEAIKTFEADSISSQLDTYSSFFLANRLFLLNLAAIYTTGFECPDTSAIIPELLSMLQGTEIIYTDFNESFRDEKLSNEYLDLFKRTIAFVQAAPKTYSSFDQFTFIRNYVNPLFAMNQKFINAFNAVSINYNDYTLNNAATSVFDKSLYVSQNTLGIYSMIQDENTLKEIRRIGKLLFYDPILSGNNMRSCASCHKPTEYFTDTSFSTAFQFNDSSRLPRNTPTLINSVYNHLLMLDGKHTTLQAQGMDVITGAHEMNSTEKELVRKVLSCNEYKETFKKLLKLTPEEKQIGLTHIVSAITYYDGSFSAFYSPFDNAMNHALPVTQQVINGFNLFMSKAKCATCHFVPNFNGVKPPFIGSEFEVLGTPGDTAFKDMGLDEGRYIINKAPETRNAFRTGSIRNAEFTRPYMHNGIFTSLNQVIDFYDAGGGQGKKMLVSNQTLPGEPLKLTDTEKKELLAFIHSLNEDIIFENPPAALPYSTNKALNNRKVGGQY